jgi:hypothetical protein
MTIVDDRNLERRIKHPKGISSSIYYEIDDDTDIKVQCLAKRMEFEGKSVYGNVALVIRRWDEDDEMYVGVFTHELERRLLVDYKGLHFSSDESSRVEREVKKELVDLFSMEYKRVSLDDDDLEDLLIVPSMFEDPMDNLFVSIKNQHRKYASRYDRV